MSPKLSFSPPAAPVDLEIHITSPWGTGQSHFEFTLTSPSGVAGFYRERIQGRKIKDAATLQKTTFEQIEQLGSGHGSLGHVPPQDQTFNEVVAIGQALYDHILPRELQTIYRDIRDRVTTLLLTSDESWFPWEMLHPTNEGDDFLCMRHQFSRWIPGKYSLPRGRQIIRRVLHIPANSSHEAGNGDKGIEFLYSSAKRISDLSISEFLTGGSFELINQLENQPLDLLHFSNHTQQAPEQPEESKIIVSGQAFRTRHLRAPVQLNLEKYRPLVVFDGAQSRSLGESLATLHHWAQTWIQRCGCSGFLAPTWSTSRGQFSNLFYQALARGETLGKAIFTARHAIRASDPSDLSWLSYRYYGSPNTSANLGESKLSLPSIPRQLRPTWSSEKPLKPREVTELAYRLVISGYAEPNQLRDLRAEWLTESLEIIARESHQQVRDLSEILRDLQNQQEVDPQPLWRAWLEASRSDSLREISKKLHALGSEESN